jgi:CubicO group peptidase (beta-lactamase class C family)
VLHRAYGHARGNGPNDAPDTPKTLLTPATPICLFSASKAVTAVLVHQLAEDGGIELDRPVAHYLPAFGQAGKSRTTIADVLAHRGRVPTLDLPKAERGVQVLEDWDRVVDLICRAPPIRSSHMAYHAITGGFILAELIQRVTGRPLSEYLDRRIRQPLAMRHFTYGLPKTERTGVALNYAAGAKVRFPLSTVAERALIVPFEDVVAASNTDTFMDAVIPAGNIYATAEETSRFFQMLLDGGVWRGRRLLKSQTVARLIAPRGGVSYDRTLVIPMRYSEGMMLGINPAGLYGPMTTSAFGHLGFMNILGWADTERDISCGLLTTGKAILGTHLIALARLLTVISRRCA